MDETYIRVKGEWLYLYRAVDKSGKTVEFYLSQKRDVNAATAFLRRGMKSQRIPTKITLDAYAASHRAVADLKANGELPKRGPDPNQQIPEQQDRTGPSPDQTKTSPDAGIEESSNGGGCHRRHRTGREDQEGTIQNRQTRRERGDDAGDLASRSGRVTSASTSKASKGVRVQRRSQFAPEP